MNKLNGWQRIWIVVAIIWAVLVTPFVISEGPDSPARLSAERANLLIKYPAFSLPPAHKDQRSRADFDPKDLVPAEEYNRNLERFKELNNKIDSYPHDMARHVLISLLVWAIPLATLYLFGMGVAWIRAGFRRTA